MRARYPAHLRAIQRLSGSNPGVLAGSEPPTVTVLDDQKPNLTGAEKVEDGLVWREVEELNLVMTRWNVLHLIVSSGVMKQ